MHAAEHGLGTETIERGEEQGFGQKHLGSYDLIQDHPSAFTQGQPCLTDLISWGCIQKTDGSKLWRRRVPLGTRYSTKGWICVGNEHMATAMWLVKGERLLLPRKEWANLSWAHEILTGKFWPWLCTGQSHLPRLPWHWQVPSMALKRPMDSSATEEREPSRGWLLQTAK